MARTRARERVNGKRAAIYARVSDKSQAEDDKTSISEQTGEMEAYCERKGLTITARYQEVGRGWSKKRPEFQRMLADARRERFDTIVCWKSDRLSRGMYPAAALMEVVEAHQIQLEAVMDAIDMKTFGLMAAIGKIELDNFRERSTMGKRGSAKQGRMPAGAPPYGYRTGDDGKPEICEPEAEVVRRIFHMYVHEGLAGTPICERMTSDDAPLRNPGSRWHKAYVSAILGREVYKGAWHYGKARWVVTEAGERIYPQPEDRWIKVPFPPLVDEETWDRAQAIKKQRTVRSKRNTKIFYLLQHLVSCAECGLMFACRSSTHTYFRRKGKVRKQARVTPQRHYHCYGMLREDMDCRKPAMIRAEQLEKLVWNQVKEMVQNPELIVAGIESLDAHDDFGVADQIAGAERDLQKVQVEEERAIRLYVSSKITEDQLDQQRRFITERLEAARATLNDLRARESMASEKRLLMENLVEWAGRFGHGLDDLPQEKRRDVLRLLVDQVLIDHNNNVSITLGIPTENLTSFEKGESPCPCRTTARSREVSPRSSRWTAWSCLHVDNRRVQSQESTRHVPDMPYATLRGSAPHLRPRLTINIVVNGPAVSRCEEGPRGIMTSGYVECDDGPTPRHVRCGQPSKDELSLRDSNSLLLTYDIPVGRRSIVVEASKVEQKSTFEITVNGVQIKVEVEKLLAKDVLETAKEHGAMPGKPEDYQLQGHERLYKPEDWVNFEEDKEFITIPIGPTDVA